VVDLHAITAQLVHEDMRGQIRSITAAFIAAGIDPKKHIVFNQSAVPQHAELAWIFNCVARIGWMERMTQFKDKTGKNAEQVSLGLLAYPSLMAADILVYRATHVPVGDDQKQHLELTRDIAQKFNIDFGEPYPPGPVGVDIVVGEETVQRLFPDGRAADRRPGTARHEPARRHQEDVEVGCRPISRASTSPTMPTRSPRRSSKAKTDPEPLPSPNWMA
jgi:tryptophanyl-tRNA synthetase